VLVFERSSCAIFELSDCNDPSLYDSTLRIIDWIARGAAQDMLTARRPGVGGTPKTRDAFGRRGARKFFVELMGHTLARSLSRHHFRRKGHRRRVHFSTL
jgi:hypothetical protein